MYFVIGETKVSHKPLHGILTLSPCQTVFHSRFITYFDVLVGGNGSFGMGFFPGVSMVPGGGAPWCGSRGASNVGLVVLRMLLLALLFLWVHI